MSDLLLGLDIGTSSSKGLLATPGGELVAVAERPLALSLPCPGWAEHDAETVWWSDALEIFRDLLEAADRPIAAIGMTGIGPAPSGRRGRPAPASGHPVWHRHSGEGRDRRADRTLRRGSDLGAASYAADTDLRYSVRAARSRSCLPASADPPLGGRPADECWKLGGGHRLSGTCSRRPPLLFPELTNAPLPQDLTSRAAHPGVAMSTRGRVARAAVSNRSLRRVLGAACACCSAGFSSRRVVLVGTRIQ
jgi:FGGY family of carbohydrate kinases, N-terminal domain